VAPRNFLACSLRSSGKKIPVVPPRMRGAFAVHGFSGAQLPPACRNQATKTKGRIIMASSNTKRIAELNDLCRKAPGIAGKMFITQGIAVLPAADQSAICEKVENFATFTPDNDPYGEHDFGAFEHEGQKIFWKIDYYAPDMQHGSENPADPKQTVRVLTIMLASEY
jgi:hypothetical protein